jgi:hypothetical protein
MYPDDRTRIRCFADHSTLTSKAGDGYSGTSMGWGVSDFVAFPQPGKLRFAFSNYTAGIGNYGYVRSFEFRLYTRDTVYHLDFNPDHTWFLAGESFVGPGDYPDLGKGTYNPDGNTNVSLTSSDKQVSFVVGAKALSPFSESATIAVTGFSFILHDDDSSAHVNLSAFRMERV